VTERRTDRVAVVGAGPYGLAVAAHLRGRGLEPRVFGRVMSFWEEHMPRGMLLRSAWRASSISDPDGRFTLDAYEREHGLSLSRPLPVTDFLAYAHWFQSQAVPEVDPRMVERVERAGNGFELLLADGERVGARSVVIATGLKRFPRRPREFDALDPAVAAHSLDATDPERFRGRTLVIVGSGQSAVETAALAHEAGGQVELIARAPAIRWLTRSAKLHGSSRLVEVMLYAPTDVGPPGLSWIVALPDAFRLLPTGTQERVAVRSIRPAAAGWLVDRVAGVKMTFDRRVLRAASNGSGVALELDDGTSRQVDELVLATGYAVDAALEPSLAPLLRDGLEVRDGYPVLGRGLESSLPGLHFAGAYAAVGFGPVMRFVSGTRYAARAVAAHVTHSG
jgi:FAD-dependent urate hydroxylase